MEELGVVSLFFGSADGRDVWDSALAVEIGPDDRRTSAFIRGFGVQHYDPSFCEATYHSSWRPDRPSFQGPRRLRAFLRVSYAEQLLAQLEQVDHGFSEHDSCVIALFNHRHTGAPAWAGDGVALRFVSVLTYEH